MSYSTGAPGPGRRQSSSRRESDSRPEVAMRKYLDIDLATQTVRSREVEGEAIVKTGRYLIAKTLLECGAAALAPLPGANPLIFAAGPLAGTSFSNANRTSVGCKSPLTGGVKEANAGGTFGVALGHLAPPRPAPRPRQRRGGEAPARALRPESEPGAVRAGGRVPGLNRRHRDQRQRPPA